MWNCIECGAIGLFSPDHVCVEIIVELTGEKASDIVSE